MVVAGRCADAKHGLPGNFPGQAVIELVLELVVELLFVEVGVVEERAGAFLREIRQIRQVLILLAFVTVREHEKVTGDLLMGQLRCGVRKVRVGRVD